MLYQCVYTQYRTFLVCHKSKKLPYRAHAHGYICPFDVKTVSILAPGGHTWCKQPADSSLWKPESGCTHIQTVLTSRAVRPKHRPSTFGAIHRSSAFGAIHPYRHKALARECCSNVQTTAAYFSLSIDFNRPMAADCAHHPPGAETHLAPTPRGQMHPCAWILNNTCLR